MPIEVTMPKLSDTMEEGKILKWLKHPGERVGIGEILAEVETDKANMELEAYDEGTVAEVRVQEGESAPVGAVIAVLSAPGEAEPAKGAPAAAKPAPSEKPPHPAERAKPQPSPRAGPAPRTEAAPKPERAAAAEAPKREPARADASTPEAAREHWRPTVVRRPETREAEEVKASPLARRIAREHGLDLGGIAGTGPGGRIVEKDVQAALGARGGAPASERAPASPADEPHPSGARRVELSRIRRTTSKRMSESKREIPHFYVSAEIAMEEAVRLKEALAALEGEYTGLTYTHLVLKAVGLALRRVPELNASYDGDAMILHEAVNVGVATALEEGLVVPVVRNCDREPLAVIVRRARALHERARSGRFGSEDLSGATFTVSNLGMLPVSEFAAVIIPPQAAILAVGTIRETPVVRDGAVVPGRLMTVTVSCDHRIVDGVLAGRFLRELKSLLENPLALVL
jgi:pyruvate dehydrogenase E2 component (dihydrolipoyllysine-residue acetyltransferase)